MPKKENFTIFENVRATIISKTARSFIMVTQLDVMNRCQVMNQICCSSCLVCASIDSANKRLEWTLCFVLRPLCTHLYLKAT